MSLRDEVTEIISDMRTASLNEPVHKQLKVLMIDAVRQVATTSTPERMFEDLGQLTLSMFYVGREHAKRGYHVPTDFAPAPGAVPDTIEQLLQPDLYRWHVEFHCDVLASDKEAAIAAADGEDWRVTRLD